MEHSRPNDLRRYVARKLLPKIAKFQVEGAVIICGVAWLPPADTGSWI
jgi:hypothetical protein